MQARVAILNTHAHLFDKTDTAAATAMEPANAVPQWQFGVSTATVDC